MLHIQAPCLLTSLECKTPKAAHCGGSGRRVRAVAAACRRGEHPRTEDPSLLYPPGGCGTGEGSVRSSSGSAACRAFTAASRGALRTTAKLLAVVHRRSGTAPTQPAQGSRQQAVPSSGESQRPGGPSAHEHSLFQAQICRSLRLCRPPTGAPSRGGSPAAATPRQPHAASLQPHCMQAAGRSSYRLRPPRHTGKLCMHAAEAPCPRGPPCTAVVASAVVACSLRHQASFRL